MKIQIKVFTPNGIEIVEYTVLEKYEDSVLAIPYGYSELIRSCEGKPTLFNNKQIIKFIE